MTPEILAAKLDGMQYRGEIPQEILEGAKENNLVIVYGASDDLMEFDGAIYEELDAYEGTVASLHKIGKWTAKNGKKGQYQIEAVWCPTPEISWSYKTKIPHSTFKIMEDEETYCIGIVFDLNHLSQSN